MSDAETKRALRALRQRLQEVVDSSSGGGSDVHQVYHQARVAGSEDLIELIDILLEAFPE